MPMLKLKLILLSPYWAYKNRRARIIAKKAKKDIDRFPESFQWNYVMRRTKKVLKALNAKLEIIGYDNLPKGAALLIPNHQSNLDIPSLINAMHKQSFEEGVEHKKCRFIAKKELESKRSLRGWMNLTSSIYIDRNNPREALKALNKFGKDIKKANEYGVIFPEGTRTKTGKLQDFQAGAFKLAKQEFLPIVPVIINGTKQLENLNRRGKTKFQIIFEKPIKAMSIMSQPNEKIAERVKNIIEKKYKPFEYKKKSGKKIFK
ncbi:MAG: 1-acyl-sn-glycerol-3-phosphate acyltransferase [Mycoplasma sp.]|nr:1-acyl-sn-glycerol-3-phosphate acyltransferase [Mycoplasma sp.]